MTLTLALTLTLDPNPNPNPNPNQVGLGRCEDEDVPSQTCAWRGVRSDLLEVQLDREARYLPWPYLLWRYLLWPYLLWRYLLWACEIDQIDLGRCASARGLLLLHQLVSTSI